MKYLAIDASTEACSVALFTDGEISDYFELCPQSHSMRLLPLVDQVLSENGVTLQELDGLIYGRGPGSFTGVRIGIGVAQGLGFSTNLPMVGVSTLQSMAQAAVDKKANSILAAIDARMSEVYFSAYQKDDQGIMQPLIDECVVAPSDVEQIVSKLGIEEATCVGTGWEAYKDTLKTLEIKLEFTDVEFPSARDMITLALPEFEKGNTVEAQDAQPVYVRDTVSWKKLPGR